MTGHEILDCLSRIGELKDAVSTARIRYYLARREYELGPRTAVLWHALQAARRAVDAAEDALHRAEHAR